MQTHTTKDGKTIATGRGYAPPDRTYTGQVVGSGWQWIKILGEWHRLDLMGARLRLYLETIGSAQEFTEQEIVELLSDCLEFD